jgi:hypothetical protein
MMLFVARRSLLVFQPFSGVRCTTMPGPYRSSALVRHVADDEAVVLAVQLLEELPIELWNGARLVKRLAPRENRKAITYECMRVEVTRARQLRAQNSA